MPPPARSAKTEGPSSSGTIHVPWWPRTAVARCAASVITALPPALTKRAAPSIFGPHAARAGTRPPRGGAAHRRRVRRSAARDAGVPKPISTRGTLVTSTSMSACSDTASSAAQRSLSTTASSPTSCPSRHATGMPPPPAAMTSTPPSASRRTWSTSRIRSGRGLGTMRRQPRPASGATCQPRSLARRRASSSAKKAPIGLVGLRREGRVVLGHEHAREHVAVGSDGSTAVSACWSR